MGGKRKETGREGGGREGREEEERWDVEGDASGGMKLRGGGSGNKSGSSTRRKLRRRRRGQAPLKASTPSFKESTLQSGDF